MPNIARLLILMVICFPFFWTESGSEDDEWRNVTHLLHVKSRICAFHTEEGHVEILFVLFFFVYGNVLSTANLRAEQIQKSGTRRIDVSRHFEIAFLHIK
jgi:hypothetical protein